MYLSIECVVIHYWNNNVIIATPQSQRDIKFKWKKKTQELEAAKNGVFARYLGRLPSVFSFGFCEEQLSLFVICQSTIMIDDI